MSVLIKGKEMPGSCDKCFCLFSIWDDRFQETEYQCGITGDYICTECGHYWPDRTIAKSAECPLIEVPEPHGRLIDANELRQDWLENGENEYVYDTNAFLDSLDNAPTIIEAEGEEA